MTPIALRSPCYTCPNYGQPGYPECAESPCQLLNAYLVAQNISPHVKPKDENLAVLFPPSIRNRAIDLSTKEQCSQAKEKIIQIKNANRWTVVDLAARINMPKDTLRAIISGRQKRISLQRYERIMEYGI